MVPLLPVVFPDWVETDVGRIEAELDRGGETLTQHGRPPQLPGQEHDGRRERRFVLHHLVMMERGSVLGR